MSRSFHSVVVLPVEVREEQLEATRMRPSMMKHRRRRNYSLHGKVDRAIHPPSPVSAGGSAFQSFGVYSNVDSNQTKSVGIHSSMRAFHSD